MSRLVGRDAECARIDRVLADTGKAQQRCLVLSGEPGIGKTVLLRYCAFEAARLGYTTLRGAGSDFEQDVPFGLLIDALDDHVRELDEQALRRSCGNELPDVALVFPALAHLASASGTRLPEERYRLHRALRQLLARLARRAPLALILDDVHWADPESVEFLAHLLRHPVRAPLLVALAMRSTGSAGALTAAVRAGRQLGAVERLRVGSMTAEEVAAIVGEGLDDRTLKRLYRESGGNPFYASALSRAYRRRAAPQSIDAQLAIEGVVPAAVVEAVTAELQALPAGTGRVLQAAAVLGDPFNAESVADVLESPAGEVDRALDAAAHALVVIGDGLAGQWRFRHPIVRNAAYASATPAWRRRLHARAAQRRNPGPGVWAHHLARSAAPGDREAVQALRDAAHAVRLRAPGTAAQWLQAALALLDDTATAERLEILVPLATALGAAGQLEESRRILRQTLPLADGGPAALRGRLLSALAVVEHMLGSHDGATGLLEHALETLEPGTAETADVLLQLGWDHLYANDLEPAATRAREARAAAEGLDDHALLAATTALHALTEITLGSFEASSRAFADALSIVSALSDELLAAHLEATLLLGYASYHLDRLDTGVELLERGIAISRATEQGQFYPAMLLLLSLMRIAQGRLADARTLARDAEDIARLANNQQWLTWSLSAQCSAATLSGDLPDAERCGEEAVAVGDELTYSYFSLLARRYLAATRLEAGDPDQCVAELLAICGDPDQPPIERPFRPAPYELLTRAELARRNPVAAEAWARRAAFAAKVVPTGARQGEALRSQAEIALARGDAAAAARSATSAADLTAAAGRALETARGHLLAGNAHLAAGDPATAADHLQRAQVGFRACGARRLDDEAAQLLRRAGRKVARGGRRPKSSDPDPLSPREREIAVLVCDGKTNREIAAQLYLSEKTVEGYLRNVFAKLDISRRGAVAAALRALDSGE